MMKKITLILYTAAALTQSIQATIINSTAPYISMDPYFSYHDNFLRSLQNHNIDLAYLFLEDQPEYVNITSPGSSIRLLPSPSNPLGVVIYYASEESNKIKQWKKPDDERKQYLSLLQILKNKGADLSSQPEGNNISLETPLCLALKNEQLDIIDWLLSNGAKTYVSIEAINPNTGMEERMTAAKCNFRLSAVLNKHYPNPISFAIRAEPQDSSFLKLNRQLFDAIKENKFENGKKLIDEIRIIHDINDCLDYYFDYSNIIRWYDSILFKAAEKDNADFVKFLLERGMNPNQKILYSSLMISRDMEELKKLPKTVDEQIRSLNKPEINALLDQAQELAQKFKEPIPQQEPVPTRPPAQPKPQPQPQTPLDIKALQKQLNILGIELTYLNSMLKTIK